MSTLLICIFPPLMHTWQTWMMIRLSTWVFQRLVRSSHTITGMSIFSHSSVHPTWLSLPNELCCVMGKEESELIRNFHLFPYWRELILLGTFQQKFVGFYKMFLKAYFDENSCFRFYCLLLRISKFAFANIRNRFCSIVEVLPSRSFFVITHSLFL